ncbi:MAG: alpha/beta fold hydrolase [Chloroflexota bacterium]
MLIHTNGIRLVGDDVGAGEPLLFVHAFPLNRRMWAPQVEAFSDRYRCMTVDLRGFGESDAPAGPYSLDQLAADLAGLLDVQRIERVTLVGLSMGGYIAFAFWRRYADRLRALVLADTRAGADTAAVSAGREALAVQAEQEGLAPVVAAQLPRLLSPAAPSDLQEWVRDMIEEATPQGVAGALRGMAARADSNDLLPRLTCPTLVVAGSADIVTPVAEMEAMARRIPQATFVALPDAGQLSNLEAPTGFNAALRGFLEGLA